MIDRAELRTDEGVLGMCRVGIDIVGWAVLEWFEEIGEARVVHGHCHTRSYLIL
jgi:hypothetical protein